MSSSGSHTQNKTVYDHKITPKTRQRQRVNYKDGLLFKKYFVGTSLCSPEVRKGHMSKIKG